MSQSRASSTTKSAGLACLLAPLLCACPQTVPEIAYETENFEIAPDFDYPICAGTLNNFEAHLDFVESSLARTLPFGQRIRYYWITQDLGSWCSERAAGCYYPGTVVIIGSGDSIGHEIVHAVLNAEARTNFFLEEALAERYSGVGAYHRDSQDLRPDPSELLWISPSDYRFGDLDYAVANHFMAYVQQRFGTGPTRGIADVVAEAAGPPELEQTFERFTGVSFAELEADWEASSRTYYRGLRETEVTEISNARFVDASLRCDEVETFGPLPKEAAPGMYRTFRLELQDPTNVEVDLRGPERVRVEIVDIRRERGARHVVDFFHPTLSGRREHPVVVGGQTGVFPLRAGTHLLIVEQDGYEYSEAYLSVRLREFPRD